MCVLGGRLGLEVGIGKGFGVGVGKGFGLGGVVHALCTPSSDVQMMDK